ncbi:MAG: hypothetical protein HY652_00660 [Acidobacteria bacterium]|nr:hypothetical protein [Acidobacteriota bacterium]
MSRAYLAAVLLVLYARGQDSNYKIEAAGACPDSVAQEIREALQPQGIRLVDASQATVCELWMRRVIPQKSPSGPASGGLAEGTLVGVLSFPATGSDFRGQRIQPGLYTLRYARIPEDGNHLGVAPSPDFLLLGPAAVDQHLDARWKRDELIQLSRQASGTNHPAPLLLLPVAGQGSFPGVQRSDHGYVVVQVKTQGGTEGGGQTVDLPFAIVLVGKAEA